MGPKNAQICHTTENLGNYSTALLGGNPQTISEHMYNSLDTRLRKRAKNDAATTQHELLGERPVTFLRAIGDGGIVDDQNLPSNPGEDTTWTDFSLLYFPI